MSGFRSEKQRQHARALRAGMTEAERLLWYHLRAHRFLGLSVRRQAPIGPYIVDFLIPSRRLILELDGGQHSPDGDAARDLWLQAQGFRLIRLWNSDVLGNLPGVLQLIAQEARR